MEVFKTARIVARMTTMEDCSTIRLGESGLFVFEEPAHEIVEETLLSGESARSAAMTEVCEVWKALNGLVVDIVVAALI
jgi:hypothetical protein